MINLCNALYHWNIDENTGFRKFYLNINMNIEREINKFTNWKKDFRTCSKCQKILPECTYFFNSGGKDKVHRYCKTCEKAKSYGWGRKYNNELNEQGKHYCTKCDRVLPLNLVYFSKTTGRFNKTGYVSNCKECIGNKFGLHLLNSVIEDIKDHYKVCHSCNLELPNNDIYFFKKSDRDNGQTVCKKCLGFKWEIQRLNMVLKSTIPNGYFYCNQCTTLKKVEDITGNGQCKECVKPKRQEYNQRPEVKERLRLARQKRRNLEKEIPFNLTVNDIEEIFNHFNNQCAYCGTTKAEHIKLYNENLHCEHIHPLTEGGFFIFGNIVPSCRSCNTSKNTKDLFTFYDYNNKFTYERLVKILNYIEFHLGGEISE